MPLAVTAARYVVALGLCLVLAVIGTYVVALRRCCSVHRDLLLLLLLLSLSLAREDFLPPARRLCFFFRRFAGLCLRGVQNCACCFFCRYPPCSLLGTYIFCWLPFVTLLLSRLRLSTPRSFFFLFCLAGRKGGAGARPVGPEEGGDRP